MATNPYVNKVQYDGNTLIDISDTTATPDKVQTGFKFYDASGRPQYGTELYNSLGRNATLVKTVHFNNLKLSDTTFSPTATAAAAIKTAASSDQTYTTNFGLYDYIARYYCTVTYAYAAGTPTAAMPLYMANIFDYIVTRGFSSYTHKKNANYNYNTVFNVGSTAMGEYYNASATRAYATGSYGLYIYDSTFGFSNRYNDAITLTLYSPRLYFSGNNATYISAASRAAIDAENTTIQWWLELYQIDVNTSYYMNRYKTAVDLSNSMLE